MKNIENYQLKKCIFMELSTFRQLITDVTHGLKQVKYEFDGIYYDDTSKAENSETYWQEDITDTLSKHFDVPVTSIHADDCEYLGVWICYNDVKTEFSDIQLGDIVVIHNKSEHNDKTLTVQVNSIEYKTEYINASNTTGMRCYGVDLDQDFNKDFDDMEIVTEHNFVKFTE